MAWSILVVDDNRLIVNEICESLDWPSLGIGQVTRAFNGREALEKIQEETVDLLLTDVEMPGLSGLELSQEVAKASPQTKIILISAYDEFEYARGALRLGVFDYIEKPLDYDVLAKTISKACQEMEREKRNLEILEKSKPALAEQFFRCPERAVRLGYKDVPGSPVLFPASCREALLAYEGDRGGMEVIRQKQIPCDTVQAEEEWELWDVDTPEKMEKVREIHSRLT